jgi:hypothetical protein
MRAIAAVLLMTLMTPALAEWTSVYSTDDGGEVFVDLSSIRRTPPTVRVWRMMRYSKISPSGAGSFRKLTIFDCIEERYRDLQTTFFTGPDVDGKMLGEAGEGDWKYVPPDTLLSVLLRRVCTP